MEDAGGVGSVVHAWVDWEVPGKPVCVRLTGDVAARLGMAVREGFKALPRRGLETGGLLIGSRHSAGNAVVVEIDDFEAIESEHAAGPAYLLSDADRRLLEARIGAREAAGESGVVVGFYRSHTRPDFGITREDANLFSTYFTNASDVFLLIRPNSGGPPTGGFIIREEGRILSDSPYAQFSLTGTMGVPAVRETPVRSPQTIQELPIQELPPPPPPRRAVQIVQPAAPRPGALGARARIWVAAAAVTALSVALFFAIPRHVPHVAPVKTGASPGLSVTNAGNSLRLSWDHQLSRDGGHAVLWIKDGQETQRLELDAKQLSEGSVVYWPSHSDVDFRFELLAPGGSVSESIRAIGGPSKPAVANRPAAGVVKRATAPVHSRKLPRRKGRAAASRPVARALTLPRSNPASGAAAAIPDAPVVTPEVAATDSRKVLNSIAPAKSLDGADPAVQVRVEPVTGARRNIPLIGRLSRRADYVPPSALRDPGLPNLPHRQISRNVNINVKVHVNAAGKVDYSEVISKVAEADRDLASLAMFAGRRWEFAPARTAGSAVAGEVILHYQFRATPGANASQAVAAR
jgi:hypothetical protein